MHFGKIQSCRFVCVSLYACVALFVFFLCTLLISCGTVAKKDVYGWYHDFDAAKKIAHKQHKNILLVFSNGRTEWNGALQENIFNKKKFVDIVSDELVLVNLDFSDDATQNDVQREKKSQLILMYNVVDMPSVFLLTEDGYYLAEIIYDDTCNSPESYAQMLKDQQDSNKEVTDAIAALKKMRGIEKVQAFDALYNRIPEGCGWCFIDIIRTVPALDKKNKTGLVEKYILEAATVDALFAFSKYDVAGAARFFVDAAESGKLSADYAQQAYYLAGSMLAAGGVTSYDTVLHYFQRSYEVSPESQSAGMIQQTIAHLETLIAEEYAEQTIRAADAK